MSSASTRFPRVIGIGASAGGLEALQDFFSHCPSDTDLTFVVIQHLSPDFKSLMAELLSRYTSMKVVRVDEELRMRRNHVYLIPPKKGLTIKGLNLVPTESEGGSSPKAPIDDFFASLAKQYGSDALGVVLSGTGSDGTKGAIAIREAGGSVLVQDPKTCKFDGMPASVIRQGASNGMDHPKDLPLTILDTIESVTDSDSSGHLLEKDTFARITSLLKSVSDIDFSSYRPSTIMRRLERRYKISSCDDIDKYVSHLSLAPEELRGLHDELLIGVTRFFRDSEEYAAFENSVIPKIVDQTAEDGLIRAWVAGCSTGEEPYSIAIAIKEYLDQHNIERKVKIFATDVDRKAVETASLGLYPPDVKKDISPERFEKYFANKGHHVEVVPEIRKSVVFSRHNVVKDPPFTKLNLVTCRNLLIYFLPGLQSKALSLFHFGLNPNGYLFLGKSEALGDFADEFKDIYPGRKIFQKLRDAKLAVLSDLNISTSMVQRTEMGHRTHVSSTYPLTEKSRSEKLSQVYETVMNKFVPPSVLIDGNFRLQHIFGDAGNYLHVPKGRSSFTLLKMVDKNLSLAISTAVSRCKKSESEIVFKDIEAEDGKHYEMTASRVSTDAFAGSGAFLISFDKSLFDPSNKKKIDVDSYDAKAYSEERIQDLSDQLSSTRESLQTTIEELETTNEELQSTNEEMMSSNEELQSSNEELHSVNEELFSVNSEYQAKIDQLTQANADIDFLLDSANIGIVFLDDELRVRRFNSQAQELVNLVPHDIGRSIRDITFNIDTEMIVRQIESTRNTGKESTFEVIHAEKDYLAKSVPYQPDNVISKNAQGKCGVVLSFMKLSSTQEVDLLRRLNQEAEEFSYVVSHDLQRPMRHILHANTDLEDAMNSEDVNPDSVRALLRMSCENVDVLSAMLNALLKYSRLRTMGSSFQEVDVDRLVRSIVAQPLYEKSNVVIGPLPRSLNADQSQVGELFRFLIENCVTHNIERSKLDIKISATSADGLWTFAIEDSGVGIHPSRYNEAFEIFRRIDDHPTKEHIGASLSLSKRIVHRHGGKIWLDQSEELGGAKVCFTIPEDAKPLI